MEVVNVVICDKKGFLDDSQEWQKVVFHSSHKFPGPQMRLEHEKTDIIPIFK